MGEIVLIVVLAMFFIAIIAIVLPIVVIATRGGKRESKKIEVGDRPIHVENVGGDVIINSKVRDFKSNKTVKITGLNIWLSTAIFQAPALVIVATALWYWSISFVTISNILAWIGAILLIPAFIGEFRRPNSLLNRIFIFPSIALIILLLLGARFVPTIALAIAAAILLVLAMSSRKPREGS